MTTTTPVQAAKPSVSAPAPRMHILVRIQMYFHENQRILFASMGIFGIAVWLGYQVIRVLPTPRDIPILHREHLTYDGVTFSPVTALIRMEKQNDTNQPVTDLTIDAKDYVQAIPDNIGTLTHLETLVIRNQPIDSLPDSIGKLTHLKTIIIANTPIRTIPDSIGNLTSLENLEIKGTHLVTIPDSIGNLTSLKALTLPHNDLHSLPQSVTKLKNLIELDITGNRFTEIPRYLPPHITFIFLGKNQIPRTDLVRLDKSKVIIGVHY